MWRCQRSTPQPQGDQLCDASELAMGSGCSRIQSRHAFSFLSWQPPATISPFQIFPEIPLTSKKWPVQESPSQADSSKVVQTWGEKNTNICWVSVTCQRLNNLSHHKAQFSSVQSLSRVWRFATPWIAAHQASLSITNSSVVPFSSCPQSLPASGSGSKF